MKRLIVGLAIFCVAFQTGVLADVALFSRSAVSSLPIEKIRTRWREDITETVFRYQIEHFSPVETSVYYLSVANDSDPGVETMASLRDSNLPVRRLSELGTFPASHGCYYCLDGETEFILRVGSVRWLNQNEVIVGGSLRRWRGNVDHAYLFRVVREQSTWVVKEHELL